MAGLFDMLTPDPQGGGLLGNVHQYVQDNNGSLLGLGMGLMSGASPQDAYANAMQGYMSGQRQDFTRRQLKAKQDEEARKRVELQNLAQQIGAPEGIQSEDALRLWITKAQQDRSHGLQAAQFELQKQQASAKEKPTYGVIGEDEATGVKRYGWIDPYARSVTPYGGNGTPPQQAQPAEGEGIRPVPPGADPKEWRKRETERLASEGAPTDHMKNKLADQEKAAAELKSEIDNYVKLVKTYGAEAIRGPVKSRMATAYQRLQEKIRIAGGLGVLNVQDIPVLEKQIEDATTSGWSNANPMNWAKPFGIEGRVEAQGSELASSADRGLAAARQAYGGKGRAAPSGNRMRFDAQGNPVR